MVVMELSARVLYPYVYHDDVLVSETRLCTVRLSSSTSR